MADDRDARRGARGRGVQRRQVMQMEHVGACGARGAQLARPGRDLALVLGVVERGEDAVAGPRPVLERRLQRPAARRRVERHRVGRAQRGGEVDLVHVDPGVEPAGVAEPAEVVARAGDERDVAAALGEAPGEGARDERRTPAREEERSGDHTQRVGQQAAQYGSRGFRRGGRKPARWRSAVPPAARSRAARAAG